MVGHRTELWLSAKRAGRNQLDDVRWSQGTNFTCWLLPILKLLKAQTIFYKNGHHQLSDKTLAISTLKWVTSSQAHNLCLLHVALATLYFMTCAEWFLLSYGARNPLPRGPKSGKSSPLRQGNTLDAKLTLNKNSRLSTKMMGPRAHIKMHFHVLIWHVFPSKILI